MCTGLETRLEELAVQKLVTVVGLMIYCEAAQVAQFVVFVGLLIGSKSQDNSFSQFRFCIHFRWMGYAFGESVCIEIGYRSRIDDTLKGCRSSSVYHRLNLLCGYSEVSLIGSKSLKGFVYIFAGWDTRLEELSEKKNWNDDTLFLAV